VTRLLFALALAAAQPAAPADYKDVPPKELGVEPVPEAKDPKTEFVVGGRNPTALVKRLTHLNGRPVADLEADMRPGAKAEGASDKGFLGPTERLLDVLAADNAYVVDELGLTHQELARHLRVLAAVGMKQLTAGKKAEPFVYHGRRFTVVVELTRGYQPSPFRDGTKTNAYVTVTNADAGKRLGYSLLVPDMAERYGFWEGTGTPYRVPPRDVVALLDFLRPAGKGR
jgi:hypothetical protein